MLKVRFENGVQKLTENAEIGLAVSAENGTVSAVVNADRIGLTAIAAACRENLEAVKKGDLSSVGGGSTTVFDASAYRIDSFTAPVSMPETSAFGVTGGENSFTVTRNL